MIKVDSTPVQSRQIIQIEGYTVPLTIIKSDGGYTYDTTDLAAIRYRLVKLNVDKIYYVVDNGQSLHFDLIFAAAKKAGWLKTNQEVRHIGFGVVLGQDKKKFKSREGNTIKLIDLLDESLIQAKKTLKEHRSDQNGNNTEAIIKSVAYSCIKYADLSNLRTNDYCFSFDKMLSFKGNTGCYQLYEYVRICSILRNAGQHVESSILQIEQLELIEKEELFICRMLLQFPEIIDQASNDLMFHSICSYLYELTNAFSQFHMKCRCLYYNENKELISVNHNRILICLATQLIIGQCFNILGINQLEKM